VISAALDPETGILGISAYEEKQGLDDSIFLSQEGGRSTRVDDPRVHGCTGPLNWYPALGRFLVAVCEGVLGLTPGGEADLYFPGEGCLPEVSPDGRWVVFWGCWDYGIRIYDPSGKTRNDYDSGAIVDLSWSPGSEKFYYLEEAESGYRLNSFDLRSGEIRTIDPEARALLRVIQAPGGVRPAARSAGVRARSSPLSRGRPPATALRAPRNGASSSLDRESRSTNGWWSASTSARGI